MEEKVGLLLIPDEFSMFSRVLLAEEEHKTF